MNKAKFPKITIVTPSYNQGQFIERTIESVLNQDYPNLEYIIMDGGSKDNTLQIIKKYQKHLIWKSEKDDGQADAINKGLRISTGDILAYLNSDDTYMPNILKKVGQIFNEQSAIDFLYGKGRLIDIHDKEIGFYNDSQTDADKLFTQCAISQPTAFWRRKVMDKVGLFDPSFQYTMDYEYWMRIAKQFDLHYFDQLVIANTRIHPDAKTSSQTHKLHLDAVRASLLHYGKVHYDWISTLADGEVPHLKDDEFLKRTLYLGHMIIKTFYYHAIFNKEVPQGDAGKLLLSRIKQYIDYK